MAAYDSLKSLVQQAIRTNGNNEITGQVLQNVLMAMIDELGGENGYAGVAIPSTNPGAPDGKVFYFATEAGTYTHFDGATLAKGIHLLVFNGVTWSHQTLYTIDSEVTSGSNNLITSGAVYTKIINAINALDATVSKSAGADGLSLSLTETDGKVTSISGSIAPQTYDAYGAASAAQIAASTDATNKVNAAKTQILGDAASDYNTLGKLEDKIQAEASRAAAAESALNTAKADKATTLAGYGINDAYTKTEVNGLVSTPHQNYVTVPTYASLPTTGSADTIYRVSNYNGSTSQVDASVYSEYAWNGSGYTFLRVVSQIGEVFDITVYNSNTKYADLAAALGTNGANVPSSIRRGGMSVKFVQSSDNKYVQFRLMANAFTTDVSQWQGVDDEPTAGSDNLVKSGGVYTKITQIEDEINGKEVVNYKSYTSTGVSKYINLSEINKVSGDTVYFKYDGGLSNLLIYSATSSGLSTVLDIIQDSPTEGHFQILPISDAITRIYIVNDNTRFPIGSTISFVTGEEYIPGINDEINELKQTDTNLLDEIVSLDEEVFGKYKSYTSTGVSKYINLSEINKVSGDNVYFKYDGGLNNLLIYSATSSGLSTVLDIIQDSPTEGHFQILPVSDLITKIAVIHDNTRFPAGSTISFQITDSLAKDIEKLNEGVEGINNDIEDIDDEINDINIQLYGGEITFPYEGGHNTFIKLTDIKHSYGDTIKFRYTGNVSNLVIYWCTPTAIGDILTITSEGSGIYHIIIPNQDNATRIYIASTIDSFPSGSTITFLGDVVNGLVNDVPNKQDTLVSGENIKTINNISILGSGNITISGGGGDSHTINAADYGFLPENTASENVANLQSILDGGNKTIYITVPGIYELNQTLLIDSNTEIVFSKGVILKKVENTGYANVFRNRGVRTRTYDENIIIKGLYIDANLTNDPNGLGTPYYGLRGHLGFACVKNLQVYDYTIVNTGDYGYGIQVNDCYKFILDGFNINGFKDGIHISSIEGFVIRNGVLCTSDDGIALNAGDWVSSNCINGPIRNGLIENVIDESYGSSQSGNFIRLHNGAWVEWQSGMVIQRGDHVISNGNLYKADCPYHATTPYRYRSTHQPTWDSYINVQDFGEVDIDNRAPNEYLRWILVKTGVSYVTADIQNVIIRNIVAKSARRLTVMSGDTQGGVYSRCIYIDSDPQSPVLPLSSYPKDVIKFENCNLEMTSSIMLNSVNIGFDIVMEEIHDSKHGIDLGTSMTKLPGTISLHRFDFSNNTDLSDISTASGIRVIAKESKKDNALANSVAGSMVCDTPVMNYPSSPITGDVVIKDGALKVYDGTDWS